MNRPYPVGKEPWRLLPRPSYNHATNHYSPKWNSVALFFNLDDPVKPPDYTATAAIDVRNWLDEGSSRGDPSISDFVANYWGNLSYGQFSCGIKAPYESGEPIIPDIKAPSNNPEEWQEIIKACIEKNAVAIWQTSGGLEKDDRRWIPSVILVQRYGDGACARPEPMVLKVDSQEYEIGDCLHIRYDLNFAADPIILPIPPGANVRSILSVLCHELAHNFLDFNDLYVPEGCTGYWDSLGNSSPPGSMSEVSSAHKELVGWLRFKQVIEKSSLPKQKFSLRPYTTSGDAIKVVPDPLYNPHEYFILEYRKSTGTDLWVPDRSLPEEGLFITHINERFDQPKRPGGQMYLLHEAPYFDPEFADFSDVGRALWTGWDILRGVLFPQGSRNAFTPFTEPSSAFYGPRSSGLSITDIHIVQSGPEEPETFDEVQFDLKIDNYTRVGWNVSDNDRCIAGRFTSESAGLGPQEIFCRNDRSVALLECRQAQWFVRKRQDGDIRGWFLSPGHYELVGDLDGDGLDEIYIRSSKYAGIFKWKDTGFHTLSIQYDKIDKWSLGSDNHELAADLDGDGKDEIFIRSPKAIGVLRLIDGRLQLLTIQENSIDSWNLRSGDKELRGRFTQSTYDEILICSSDSLGVVHWKSITPESGEPDTDTELRLRTIRIHNKKVDGWRLSSIDKHCIVDLDGDGLDEIYIRSPQWAGVLKWIGDRLQVMWMRYSNIEYSSNKTKTIPLTEHDRSYGGRFLTNRDGILHREDNSGVAILTWENSQIQVRQFRAKPLAGMWNLPGNDKFVVGDFHRAGPFHLSETKTRGVITDDLADVFIHNAWGTGMISFNHPSPDPAKPGSDHDQLSITWINKGGILFRDPPIEDNLEILNNGLMGIQNRLDRLNETLVRIESHLIQLGLLVRKGAETLS